MNIILVTNSSIFGRFLAGSLAQAAKLDRIIIEYGRPPWKYYYKKFKRVGPINFVFQYFLNRWFEKQGRSTLPHMEMPEHIRVRNVNFYDFDPNDIVIGYGTSYIFPRTLKRLRNGFLNIHSGILPEYRGVKSEFWVMYNKDFNKAGWTLHFMTPKIDAGDIVIKRYTTVSGENPGELRCKILREAIPVLAHFINTVRSKGVNTIQREPQSGGAYYTTPTLKQWFGYKR